MSGTGIALRNQLEDLRLNVQKLDLWLDSLFPENLVEYLSSIWDRNGIVAFLFPILGVETESIDPSKSDFLIVDWWKRSFWLYTLYMSDIPIGFQVTEGLTWKPGTSWYPHKKWPSAVRSVSNPLHFYWFSGQWLRRLRPKMRRNFSSPKNNHIIFTGTPKQKSPARSPQKRKVFRNLICLWNDSSNCLGDNPGQIRFLGHLKTSQKTRKVTTGCVSKIRIPPQQIAGECHVIM